MMTMLLAAWVMVMRLFGLYVAVLVLAIAAAFAIAGVAILVEALVNWVVHRIRCWRVARDLDREREEHRLRSVALTGTKGLPPAGGPKRAA